MSHRFTPEERARFAEDGFVVRRHVFDARDCQRLAGDCEALIAELEAAKQGPKHKVGSYMFEMRRHQSTVVKWEPFAPDLVQGVEFFLHLSPPLAAWAADPRLTDPAKDLVGEAEVIPFTEKLNVKRKREGGHYTLHQDASYWSNVTPLYRQIGTAMILLDDATLENGCLEVAPGSQRGQSLYARRETPGFGAFEMDEAAFDESRITPLEAPAGSVIFFGSFLVHRSAPNRSPNDRRALLLSYQPAGNPHSRELERPAVIQALA